MADGFYFQVTLPGLSPDTRPILENYFVAGIDQAQAEKDLRAKYGYKDEEITWGDKGNMTASPPLQPGDVVRQPAIIR
jgi:hypothetical protein